MEPSIFGLREVQSLTKKLVVLLLSNKLFISKVDIPEIDITVKTPHLAHDLKDKHVWNKGLGK